MASQDAKEVRRKEQAFLDRAMQAAAPYVAAGFTITAFRSALDNCVVQISLNAEQDMQIFYAVDEDRIDAACRLPRHNNERSMHLILEDPTLQAYFEHAAQALK